MKNDIFLSKDSNEKWRKDIQFFPILYIHAMNGFGKTSQAQIFAKENFRCFELFDMNKAKSLEQMRERLIYDSDNIDMIIIDSAEKLIDRSEQEALLELLLLIVETSGKIKAMVLSTGELPSYLLPLKLSKQLVVEDKVTLILQTREIFQLLKNDVRFSRFQELELQKYATRCTEFSSGYPFATLVYIERIAEHAFEEEVALSFAKSDLKSVFEYELNRQLEVYAKLEEQELRDFVKRLFIRLSVYQSFTKEHAKKIMGYEHAEIVLEFLVRYGYLEKIEADLYSFEPNFYRYLWDELIELAEIEGDDLLEIAGLVMEEECNYRGALRCYYTTKNYEKVVEILIYLSENADGCEFAAICDQYIKELPSEIGRENPRFIGAKALIDAYSMRSQAFGNSLTYLKELAGKKEGKISEEAKYAYVRTVIATPIGSAEKLKDSFFYFLDYIRKNGIRFEHIMPTGNMPTLINGGLDLLPWARENKMVQLAIKKSAEIIIGYEFIGCYDIIMGELDYERNQKVDALKRLTKGANEANRDGSIRAQYTAAGVMARLFQSENQQEKAIEALNNIHRKANKEKKKELLPNIRANKMILALLTGNSKTYNTWCAKSAPNEFAAFYITARFELFIKAKVYIAQEKYLSALHIIEILEEYATICNRKYFLIQINVLKAIIYSRRGEEWESYLIQAMKAAEKYKIIRVLADEGAPLLHLFQQVNWSQYNVNNDFVDSVQIEMETMAKYYPLYLQSSKKMNELTKKETEVLLCVARGYTNSEIAKIMGVNIGTIKFHIANIMRKYDVGNRVLLAKIAREEGIS